MKRRSFNQATLATLALGQTIMLSPDAHATSWWDRMLGTPKLYGQRKAVAPRKRQGPQGQRLQQSHDRQRRVPELLDRLRHSGLRDRRQARQGRRQPRRPEQRQEPVREGPVGPDDQQLRRSPPLPDEARGCARRRQVAAHHLGRGLRHHRAAHPQGDGRRQARRSRDPDRPLAHRRRDDALPERDRLAVAVQPPRAVFVEQARRQLREPGRNRLGDRRLRARQVHPELRRQLLRSAPGRDPHRQTHHPWALRQRRQARDAGRAHVEHRGPIRRVAVPAPRHRPGGGARDGQRDHRGGQARRGVARHLEQRQGCRACRSGSRLTRPSGRRSCRASTRQPSAASRSSSRPPRRAPSPSPTAAPARTTTASTPIAR